MQQDTYIVKPYHKKASKILSFVSQKVRHDHTFFISNCGTYVAVIRAVSAWVIGVKS